MNANRYMRDSLRTADRSNMDRLKLECALGLCGEAGEVAEQVKKHLLAFAKANSDFLNNRENQSATASKQSKESVE